MQSPSVAIVGTDALLAARPATPVQLAHACLRLGFDVVVPVSWGDELVATECLRQLTPREATPAIVCSCPYVAGRLLATGPHLEPFLLPIAAPPVAAARYLRRLYGETPIHITYLGACPSGRDAAIDRQLTPQELLDAFEEHDVSPQAEPKVFEGVIPPDRRRFASQPGGLPTPELLWSGCGAPWLIEIEAEDYAADLAEYLLGHECVLLDLSVRLGCVCSGTTASRVPAEARAAVSALEPPRAPRAVIESGVEQDVSQSPAALAALVAPAAPIAATMAPPEATPASPAEEGRFEARESAPPAEVRPEGAPSQGATSPEEEERAAEGSTSAEEGTGAGRRRISGISPVRPHPGSVPVARTGEGRSLPRAYAGRRRPSPPAGGGVITPGVPPSAFTTPTEEPRAEAPAESRTRPRAPRAQPRGMHDLHEMELPPPERPPVATAADRESAIQRATEPAPTVRRARTASAARAEAEVADRRARSRVLLLAAGALAAAIAGGALWRAFERRASDQRPAANTRGVTRPDSLPPSPRPEPAPATTPGAVDSAARDSAGADSGAALQPPGDSQASAGGARTGRRHWVPPTVRGMRSRGRRARTNPVPPAALPETSTPADSPTSPEARRRHLDSLSRRFDSLVGPTPPK